jgi:KipI family sensor histidine kinase inhibitor
VNVRRSGERAAVLDCADQPAAVAEAVRTLAALSGIALTDVVPGATTVLVIAADPDHLAALLSRLPELPSPPAGGTVPAASTAPAAVTTIEIPVRYDGPDLSPVAAAAGLSVAEVIALHGDATYVAAFTGFAPGFAYLTGLDPRLVLPRRSTPRPSVPAGSLAIADIYSAIYPRQSPGGWHLIGTTDADLFDPTRSPPALISPGTRVRFVR